MGVKIHISNTYTKLEAPPAVLSGCRNYFKIENDFHLWKSKPFLRYQYLIGKTGFFYTGLVNLVYSYIVKKYGVRPEIIDTRDGDRYRLDATAVKNRLESFPFTLRPYQQEAVEIGLQKPRGVFEHATGTGKTVTLAALLKAISRPSLIVTGKKDLAFQLQQEIAEYTGEEVGIIGGGVFNPKKFTVAIVSSLMNKSIKGKKRKVIDELINSTEALFIDECHHMQAKTWKQLASQAVNAYWRYGFTATFLTSKIQKSEGKEQQNRATLMLHTGPVIHQVLIKDAVEQNYLAHPFIYYIPYNLQTNKASLRGKPYVEEYNSVISDNSDRTELITDIVEFEMTMNSQVIIFVVRKDHGLAIQESLINRGIRPEAIAYADGDLSKDEREKYIGGFKAKKYSILIGTTIIGEGLNFFCNAGINACAGDSDISAVQRLGRILRKDKTSSGDVDVNSKSFVRYYDIFDYNHPWFERQSINRRECYANLGFPPEKFDEERIRKAISNQSGNY